MHIPNIRNGRILFGQHVYIKCISPVNQMRTQSFSVSEAQQKKSSSVKNNPGNKHMGKQTNKKACAKYNLSMRVKKTTTCTWRTIMFSKGHLRNK
jgi:hypothetical protein